MTKTCKRMLPYGKFHATNSPKDKPQTAREVNESAMQSKLMAIPQCGVHAAFSRDRNN
jgi:hypothetical protein